MSYWLTTNFQLIIADFHRLVIVSLPPIYWCSSQLISADKQMGFFLIVGDMFFFLEISFYGLTYPFLGGRGGKAQRLKKISWPHVIFNIPGPPWFTLKSFWYLQNNLWAFQWAIWCSRLCGSWWYIYTMDWGRLLMQYHTNLHPPHIGNAGVPDGLAWVW